MTADTTCEREAAIKERRLAYEAEVVSALLDESASEREERLNLVRLAQAMVLGVLDAEEEDIEN